MLDRIRTPQVLNDRRCSKSTESSDFGPLLVAQAHLPVRVSESHEHTDRPITIVKPAQANVPVLLETAPAQTQETCRFPSSPIVYPIGAHEEALRIGKEAAG